jgi:tetratricopeptide (TPR) repeat protein
VTWKKCTRKGALAFVSVLLFTPSAHPQTKQYDLPPVGTFSIVAIDPATGQLGVAVASRYFSVGSVVPWSEANVGAVATQANVNEGKVADAREAAKKAIAYAPERSSAHITLGLLDYSVGDKDEALAEFKKAKQLEPDFSKQLNAVLQFRPTFKGMLNDKVFMEKVNALQ